MAAERHEYDFILPNCEHKIVKFLTYIYTDLKRSDVLYQNQETPWYSSIKLSFKNILGTRCCSPGL